jgi:peroxiredoxin
MPYLQAIYEKWPRDKLEILAISVGERAAFVQSFVDRQGLTFPALLDSDEAVSEIYQISSFPTTFFINADGIISEIKEGRFVSQFEIEDILKSL